MHKAPKKCFSSRYQPTAMKESPMRTTISLPALILTATAITTMPATAAD
jgi:hypothetical protein